MKPWERKAYSAYGASMGRRSCKPSDLTGKVHLARFYLDQGGYDKGGAYWGSGLPLFCLWDDEGSELYTRGASRERVKEEYRGQISGTFYR